MHIKQLYNDKFQVFGMLSHVNYTNMFSFGYFLWSKGIMTFHEKIIIHD